PRAALRRHPRQRAPAGPAHPPAIAPRVYQPRTARPDRAPPRQGTRGHHRREDEVRPAPPPRTRAHPAHPPQPPLPGHRHRTPARAALHPRARPPAPRRARRAHRPQPPPPPPPGPPSPPPPAPPRTLPAPHRRPRLPAAFDDLARQAHLAA